MSKVISIVSLKGGVGKTSSVVSLGDAIAGFGKKVLLVDGDFSAPNLGLHLNIVDPGVTLHHVLAKRAHAKDAIYKQDNFDVLPASIFERIKISPFRLKENLRHLKRSYDYIIIDSPPSLKEDAMAVMFAADEILFVTTPDYPTLSSTMKSIKMVKQRGTPIDGVILNKVYNKNFELNLDEIEETTGVPVMAVIPHDINILKAQSEFVPVTSHKPKSKVSEEYKKLAASLIGEKYKPTKLKRFWGWVNPKKQEVNRAVFYERVFK